MRKLQVLAITGIASITLAGGLVVSSVKSAMCWGGPCDGGLYECEIDGVKTCDCPPIGSNTDDTVIYLTQPE